MNIFILDQDPAIAAQHHCDKHVVKMILETAQMLSTAHRLIDGDERADRKGLYKAAYSNHPCTVWIRESRSAYYWAFSLFQNLCIEYTNRYGRNHASARLIEHLALPPVIRDVARFRLADAPQAMPDQYKVTGDPVAAYRQYYSGEKRRFAAWKNARPPSWWEEQIKETL